MTDLQPPRVSALRETRTLLWRARAPMRLSFAGGGTDFAHVYERRRGAVLSSAITLYATASLYSSRDETQFRSLERGIDVAASDAPGALPLHSAAARLMRAPAQGIIIETSVEAPPHSGLGASSALLNAVLAVLARYRGLDLRPLDLARLSVFVERQVAGIPGGIQDPYPSALGGVCYIEFDARGVEATRIDVSEDAAAELESRLLLMRHAGVAAERPANNGPEPDLDPASVDALRALVAEMRGALIGGRIGAFSLLLHEAWILKREIGQSADANVEDAYGAALAAGALGGKQLGGPGGRHLALLVEPSPRRAVLSAVGDLGWVEVPVRLAVRGAQVWSGRLT